MGSNGALSFERTSPDGLIFERIHRHTSLAWRDLRRRDVALPSASCARAGTVGLDCVVDFLRTRESGLDILVLALQPMVVVQPPAEHASQLFLQRKQSGVGSRLE